MEYGEIWPLWKLISEIEKSDRNIKFSNESSGSGQISVKSRLKWKFAIGNNIRNLEIIFLAEISNPESNFHVKTSRK